MDPKEKKWDQQWRDYPTEIIVKFREEGAWLEQTEEGLVPEGTDEPAQFDRFFGTLSSIPGATARRSFYTNTDRLRAINEQATVGWLGANERNEDLDRRLPLPSLERFVRVRIDKEMDSEEAHTWVREFAEDELVEYAVRAAVPGPPPVQDLTDEQGYLDPSTDGGVNAEWAWSQGLAGQGIQVCDCEYGFHPGHADLPNVTVVYNDDGDLSVERDHGTQVLGVLAGKADGEGVSGICHEAALLFASESGFKRVECLNAVLAEAQSGALHPGDVVLLEMQALVVSDWVFLPAECDPDVHAATMALVGLGIVVVAAAGNSGVHLDHVAPPEHLNRLIWQKGHPDYDDSGAIMVGAGNAPGGADAHARADFSNKGTRVDCQGWGNAVCTTGGGGLFSAAGLDQFYARDFGGTSSAAAIVAGVVACLQGFAKSALGGPLDPWTVRNLLRRDDLGIPQHPGDPPEDHIGPLPDLERLMNAAANP
jgi:subtilisin family serine protease